MWTLKRLLNLNVKFLPMDSSELYEYMMNQITSGQGSSIVSDPNSDTSMQILQNLISKYAGRQMDSPIYLALVQTLLQRGFDMDARSYDSVQSQVERLMSAGMSRTQALLTATAGEAVPTQSADLATAGQSAIQNRLSAVDSASNMFSSVGGVISAFLGNYGNVFSMAGDSLVQPIGEEIYSWINKGIEVPDLARADAQHFKMWCLGMLKDENGNIIEPPAEARALINSKEWRRMASRPSGWTAFQRYFNANYSTRGYHEDFADAERIRHLADMDVATKKFQNIAAQEVAMRSTFEQAKFALQGVRLDMSDPNSPFTFVVGKNGEMIYQDGILFDENGNLRENLPDLLAAFNEDCATTLATASFQGSPEYIEATRLRMLSDERAKRLINELEVAEKQLDVMLHKTSNAIAGEDLKQSQYTTQAAKYNADYSHREHDLFQEGEYNERAFDLIYKIKDYFYSTRLYWNKLSSGDSRSFFENLGTTAGTAARAFLTK